MRSKSKRPIKRLLAKLPRSSSGSRELSANSKAAALPADIFDVSMTDAAGFAEVSSAICFSGASSDDFIFLFGGATLAGAAGRTVAARRSLALPVLVKCSSVLGVLAKQIARRKFVPGTGMNPIHVRHDFLEADAFRITQRPSSKDRKARPENHAVV